MGAVRHAQGGGQCSADGAGFLSPAGGQAQAIFGADMGQPAAEIPSVGGIGPQQKGEFYIRIAALHSQLGRQALQHGPSPGAVWAAHQAHQRLPRKVEGDGRIMQHSVFFLQFV